MTTNEILLCAANAKRDAALLSTNQKNDALYAMADALLSCKQHILLENQKDVQAAKERLGEVMTDRLRLDENRIKAMADGIRAAASLNDPVGRILEKTTLKNGLEIKKVSVPFGVVAVIFESRPNVTSDAAALLIKSGNACVLRGGKDAFYSNAAIVSALKSGLKNVGLNPDIISLITDTSRDSATALMTASGLVDLLIPRGGKGLIDSCVKNATVPCIETGTGICHIYVDEYADITKALDIIENAKMSRPSVCNAAEVCLVNKNIADTFLPLLKHRLESKAQKCTLILDDAAGKIIEGVPADENSFDSEFLSYTLAVGIVDDTAAAIKHIEKHSTHHSEAIITENQTNAALFTASVDSAAVYVNASTRFTDGGEFGLGCEIGISTQKLHARGPMGLCEMNTYKYIINGNGQIR